MQLPNVVHPKNILINGFTLQIVAYCAMTDEQALKAAMIFCRNHKLKNSQKKGVIRVATMFDEHSVKTL